MEKMADKSSGPGGMGQVPSPGMAGVHPGMAGVDPGPPGVKIDLIRQVAPVRAERAPQPRVVVAGHFCLDIFPDLSKIPEGQFLHLFKPGHMVITGPIFFGTGGAAANTSLALHRLGIPTHMIAKIGNDPLGAIARAVVQRSGLELATGIITTPDAATAYTVIISPPGVDRIFMACTGANDSFGANDIDFRLLEEAAVFHFGYPPVLQKFYQHGGRELVDLLHRAKKTGVTTSLDLTLPDPAGPAGQVDWLAVLGACLPSVDIFLPSVEELLFMLRRKTYDVLQEAAGGESLLKLVTPELLHSLSAQMLEMGVKIAGLKLGERGFYMRTAGEKAMAGMGRGQPPEPAAWADQTLWAPAYEVIVAGTTGAGDAAIAGFISGLLRGLDPRRALSAAAGVGACNVEALDGLSGLLSWEDTLGRIAAGWKQRPLDLNPAEWDWDAGSGVWVGK